MENEKTIEEKLNEEFEAQEKEEVKEEKKEPHKKHDKKESKELESIKNEVIKLTEALALEKEKSMRIQAEMQNFRRRKEEEVSNMYKYANEDILKSLIPIVDNFERALALENEENKQFLAGFNMIYKDIMNIFAQNEVTAVEEVGVEFDPSIHEAVMQEAVEGTEAGKVILVMQKGYKYKDRLLRPAMVKVSC